jgi:hypothetical protein
VRLVLAGDRTAGQSTCLDLAAGDEAQVGAVRQHQAKHHAIASGVDEPAGLTDVASVSVVDVADDSEICVSGVHVLPVLEVLPSPLIAVLMLLQALRNQRDIPNLVPQLRKTNKKRKRAALSYLGVIVRSQANERTKVLAVARAKRLLTRRMLVMSVRLFKFRAISLRISSGT